MLHRDVGGDLDWRPFGDPLPVICARDTQQTSGRTPSSLPAVTRWWFHPRRATATLRRGVAPLVLDDPVNSLDYKRLDGVIDRVVAHV